MDTKMDTKNPAQPKKPRGEFLLQVKYKPCTRKMYPILRFISVYTA